MKLSILAALLLVAPASAAARTEHQVDVEAVVTAAESGKVRNWKGINASLFRNRSTDPAVLAMRAYIWGMPMVAAARIRAAFSAPPPAGQGTPINHFVHRRKLAGPEMRVGVGPNNDTIYSLAWVDLHEGPMILRAPDFGHRYYTFSINFADSSAAQSLGQRTHGGLLPPLFLHGPGWNGRVPAGMVDVPVPTRTVNIAGRILVRSPDEYPAVAALQDRISLTRWQDWQAGRRDAPPPPGKSTPLSEPGKSIPAGMQFLEALGQILREWDVRAQDREAVRELQSLGITPSNGFNPDVLKPDSRAAVIAGLEAGRRLVLARSLHLGVQHNGWTINYLGPRFGKDYLLRAGVAKDQIFVALPEEAVYPVGRVDATGKPLDGHRCYAIRFARDAMPPARAFWSITAYDDAGFMIPNSENRYSVGDRTSLKRQSDGSVTVWLSADRPANEVSVNWLPVGEAPFYLMLRLYRPSAGFLRGGWTPPPITSQSCHPTPQDQKSQLMFSPDKGAADYAATRTASYGVT